MVEIQDEMEALGGKHRLSRANETQFAQLGDEFDSLVAQVDKLIGQRRSRRRRRPAGLSAKAWASASTTAASV